MRRPNLRPLLVLLLSSFALCVQAASLQDAQNLLRQGQHAKALDEVNELISANPKDRQARFLKGVVLAELNRLDEAAAVFSKLTEEAPELPEPYNNLAVIYAQQKQYDKARTALEMSIRTHPTYATAHENLGDLYTQMARQAYDRALQIDSGNTNAQAKLKLLRDMQGVGGRPPATTARSSAATTVASSSVAVSAAPTQPAPLPVPAKPVVIAAASSSIASSKAPVVEKPAEKPADKPVAGNANADIQKTVEAWAAAWSRKDVKGYLAAYGRNFEVPGGGSRKEWEAEREARIDKPGSIKVALSDIRIKLDGDTATVQFRQHYNSKTLNTSTQKVLLLNRQGGRWLIQQERVGR
jgi:tetratricopeptide (TPR) repeat protein